MLIITKEKKIYEAIHETKSLVIDEDSQDSFTPWNTKKGTPTWELWNEIITTQVGCFKPDDTIVLWNPYAPLVLLQDFKVPARNITLLGLPGEDTKKNLANQLGINYTEINQRNLIIMRNSFDYVIKNSPWDKNINIPGVVLEYESKFKWPYQQFGQIGFELVKPGGIVIDILPSNWFGVNDLKGFREWLLKNWDILELRIINNVNKEVFDLPTNQDIVVMIARKNSNPDNSKVRFRYHDEQVFDLDLDYINKRYGRWLLFKGKTGFDIVESVMSHSQRPMEEDSRRSSKYYVEGEIHVHLRDKRDPARNWTLNQSMGIKDPWRTHYDSNQDAKDHYEWYKSDHFAYVFSSIKSHHKTTGGLHLTGYHKFDKDKNGNIDINKTFKISQSQQDTINKWKLSK